MKDWHEKNVIEDNCHIVRKTRLLYLSPGQVLLGEPWNFGLLCIFHYCLPIMISTRSFQFYAEHAMAIPGLESERVTGSGAS